MNAAKIINVSRQKRALAAAVATLLLGAFSSLACVHHRGAAAGLHGEDSVDYPAWVLASAGAKLTGGERTFDAVGQIDGMRNVALARATADNRARAEVARLLTVFFGAVLAEVHNQQPAALAKSSPAGKYDVLLKLLLAATLPNVQVVEHWFHPDRGAVFALGRVEVDDMHESIGRLRDLPEPVQAAVLARLEETHQAWLNAAKS